MPDVPTFLCFQGVDRITTPYSKDITSSQPLSTSYELVISKLFQFPQQVALLTKRNTPILLEKYTGYCQEPIIGSCYCALKDGDMHAKKMLLQRQEKALRRS